MGNNRYAINVSFYAYGPDEKKALEEAIQIVEDLKMKYDNDASVDSMRYADFECLSRPEVKNLDELKTEIYNEQEAKTL